MKRGGEEREKEKKENKKTRLLSTSNSTFLSLLPFLTSLLLLPALLLLTKNIRYARLAFAIEMLGALSVAIFGFFASRRPLPPASLRSLAAAGVTELPPFVVHVLIPCYTEPLGIVAEAVWAAHAAPLPSLGGSGKNKNSKIKKTVWLLDDGNDPDKAAWVAGLAKSEGSSSSSSVKYVSNRPKAAHELNGKASNLNHALGMIYPAGSEIGPEDLIAVFDADQVAAADFWERMLPPFVSSSSSSFSADDVALVLSPQRFGNVDPACDVFNHGNAHFWEVALPGMAATGAVVCTGSNLVLRASALAEVGGFNPESVTEDHCLGVSLARAGYSMAYVPRYLAVGEAPEQGAVFRQRSRWAKGHAAAWFSRSENPLLLLLKRELTLGQALAYASGAISYASAALGAPLFALAPLVAAKWGVAPAAPSRELAVVLLPYFFLSHAVCLCLSPEGISPRLLRALAFNVLSGRLLWWTYAKAAFNSALRGAGLKRPARFKTTVKTGASAASGLSPGGTPRASAPGASKASAAFSPSGGGAGKKGAAPAPRFDDDGGYDASPTKRGNPGSSLLHAAPSSIPAAPSSASVGTSTGALERLITMPELLRALDAKPGERLGWDLEVTGGGGGDDKATAGGIGGEEEDEGPEFGSLTFESLKLGVIRDLWAPVAAGLASGAGAVSLLAGLLAAWPALSAPALAASSPRGNPGAAAAAAAARAFQPFSFVAACWGLLAAIPAALLLAYAAGWGRGRASAGGEGLFVPDARLRRACSAAAAAALVLSAAALTCTTLLSPPTYDYGHVLSKAYLFFDAQKSGPLTLGEEGGWGIPSNRVPWRGDSAMHDSGPNGVDLVGGFYDAGDHLKASISIGVSASLLAWGLLEFPEAHRQSGQADIAAAHVRHAAEYLLKCHTGDEEFVGQVGDFKTDHDFWGRPEDMDSDKNMKRPFWVINATHPGSDLAAEAAAALAAAAKVWESREPVFARRALVSARSLYAFAKKHQGKFSASVPQMALVYNSSAFRDDLAWAAGWLALAADANGAPGEGARYAREAQGWLDDSWKHEKERWYYFVSNWNNMAWNAQLLLARLTGAPPLLEATKGFLDGWRFGKVVNVTAGGLAYADDWGTLRNSANSALLALVYAKHVGKEKGAPYACWAQVRRYSFFFFFEVREKREQHARERENSPLFSFSSSFNPPPKTTTEPTPIHARGRCAGLVARQIVPRRPRERVPAAAPPARRLVPAAAGELQLFAAALEGPQPECLGRRPGGWPLLQRLVPGRQDGLCQVGGGE